MYALKPIVALPEQIPLPKVMYELPKIQGGGVTSSSCASEANRETSELVADFGRQVPLPEINLLEARQVKILKEIFDLKSCLDQLTVAVRINDASKLDFEPYSIQTSSAFTNKNAKQTPVSAEIIVSAHPDKPPYFLLSLQRIWTDTKFNVKVYTNSCYGDVTKNSFFEEHLLASNNSDALHHIDLTLIWKNVKDIQVLTKVYDFPFEGEANIIRYLTRLIDKYNYEKLAPEVSISIDNVLDLCLRLPYEELRYKNATVAKFASYLDKNSWLLNSSDPSIVDVAVWSALKREANNKIPRELKTWFDLCEKTFLSV